MGHDWVPKKTIVRVGGRVVMLCMISRESFSGTCRPIAQLALFKFKY